MSGFIIKTGTRQIIRFNAYYDLAPFTCAAFAASLPFSRKFIHARYSGPEIWIDDAPLLDVPQENASIHVQAGEIVIGPRNPVRNKIAGFIGIFYDEGKLLDCGNIFGKVMDEDLPLLKALGDTIWRQGVQELVFEENTYKLKSHD